MKLYAESPHASISMHDDCEIRDALQRVIKEEEIDHVLETGTYEGLGSTRMIAASSQIRNNRDRLEEVPKSEKESLAISLCRTSMG
jgi:hypothetical protein